jgi:hypothetical protein
MTDEILDELLGQVKPPERGFVLEQQAKARDKRRRPRRVRVPLLDFDHGWLDQAGRRHFEPHPLGGWYDLGKTVAVRVRGMIAIIPGIRWWEP